MDFKRRDIYLKIEPLSAYSPLAPIVCARHYGRDCMLNPGHEAGRVTPSEIFEASLDALVYREYLDSNFYECRTDGDFSWWPAQRPDDVFVAGEEEPVQWTRKLVTSMKTMVKNWHLLGFIVKQDDRYVETERT